MDDATRQIFFAMTAHPNPMARRAHKALAAHIDVYHGEGDHHNYVLHFNGNTDKMRYQPEIIEGLWLDTVIMYFEMTGYWKFEAVDIDYETGHIQVGFSETLMGMTVRKSMANFSLS